MLNYYRRFLPGLAGLLVPLHQALAGATKPSNFKWSADCEVAFKAAKSSLANATLLQHPSPFAETAITVDASDHAIGAELAQKPKSSGNWKPVAFFSKTVRLIGRFWQFIFLSNISVISLKDGHSLYILTTNL